MCATSRAVSCPALVLGVQTFPAVRATKAMLLLKIDCFLLGQREYAISQSLILWKGLGVSGVPQYNCLWKTDLTDRDTLSRRVLHWCIDQALFIKWSIIFLFFCQQYHPLHVINSWWKFPAQAESLLFMQVFLFPVCQVLVRSAASRCTKWSLMQCWHPALKEHAQGFHTMTWFLTVLSEIKLHVFSPHQ